MIWNSTGQHGSLGRPVSGLGMVLKDSAWKAWVPVFDRGLELMLEIIFLNQIFFEFSLFFNE